MASPGGTPAEPTPPPAPPQRRWLIAAWPGMGNVAVIAAGYLIQKLALRPVAELGTPGLFDIKDVEIEKGIISTPRQPRSLLFRMTEPTAALDLTVFLGEAQPDHGVFALAQGLLEHTEEYGINRVITFASMSTPMDPRQQPRVFGAATSGSLLDEILRAEVQVMNDGQIGGLNGVLLGAAAQRSIDGLCLLGEIPYFAAGVGNPKAAKAVLDAFCLLSRLELDLEELAKHAEAMEESLLKLQAETSGDTDDEDEIASEATPPPDREPKEAPAEPDAATLDRIERLFAEARRDRAKVVNLKQELDRTGLFRRFEDRFLDLFKRAE
ncbi:MAG: hypothetical protein DYG92_03055 [Leptolyngbya sp. PLA1]|nr:hypothetical protein [Leptolyngbya sp. PLA1]